LNLVVQRKKYAWVAGLIAGGFVGLTPSSTRNFTAQLTFSRSVEVLCRFIYHKVCCAPTRKILDDTGISGNLDVGLMMFSSFFVLKDYVYGGNHLQPAYKYFLGIHGGKPKHILKAAHEAMVSTAEKTGLCQTVHPSQSCISHATNFYSESFLQRSVPMYARLFSISLIISLVRRKNILSSLKHFLLGVSQSSVFLASYCSASWLVFCFTIDKKWLKPYGIFGIIGILSGACLWLEKKSRRLEIALYVFGHALYVICSKLNKKFPGQIPRHGNTLVSMICCSFLLHQYVNNPELIRPGYKFILQRLIDNGEERHESIVPGMIKKQLKC
jgi:hypothetical protein